jgi:hypothetical protein
MLVEQIDPIGSKALRNQALARGVRHERDDPCCLRRNA